jgi:hypothetical protein
MKTNGHSFSGGDGLVSISYYMQQHTDQAEVIIVYISFDLPFAEFDGDIVVAQAAIFFTAGFESNASTTSFTLYELAMQPHLQTRLRTEILDVLDKNEGQLTYEAVRDMEYLHMAISGTTSCLDHQTVTNSVPYCRFQCLCQTSRFVLRVRNVLLAFQLLLLSLPLTMKTEAGSSFIKNVSGPLPCYKMLHPRRQYSSYAVPSIPVFTMNFLASFFLPFMHNLS